MAMRIVTPIEVPREARKHLLETAFAISALEHVCIAIT
jgi:hypothetical protein